MYKYTVIGHPDKSAGARFQLRGQHKAGITAAPVSVKVTVHYQMPCSWQKRKLIDSDGKPAVRQAWPYQTITAVLRALCGIVIHRTGQVVELEVNTRWTASNNHIVIEVTQHEETQ